MARITRTLIHDEREEDVNKMLNRIGHGTVSKDIEQPKDNKVIKVIYGKNESKKMVSKEGGLKYSKDKLEWSYFPFDAAEKIMEIMQYGSKKYEWNNWKKNESKVYFDAGIRHLKAHLMGEKYDKESGLTHLAHANCNFLFALWVEEIKNDT